jgi:hypothetical protein
MRQIHRHSMKEDEYINELYQLLRRGSNDSSISDWVASRGLRHSNQMLKNTFKYAGREDLIEYLIKEEDIAIGDPIRSRFTGRFGKVTGIHKDGDTIEVLWEAGGRQLLSKESVFKMKEKNIDSVKDLTKVKSVYDNYGDIEK